MFRSLPLGLAMFKPKAFKNDQENIMTFQSEAFPSTNLNLVF